MNSVEDFKMMIPGADESRGKALEVVSPYDGKLIATVATVNARGVEQALRNATGLFFDRKRWIAVDKRIEILERAILLMQEQAEELAREASREGGKPLYDSRIEMGRAIDSLRICVDTLRTDCEKPPEMGVNPASKHRVSFIRKEPIGVVVAVSAFNHPLNLIAHQIGPAIATGCPVIVKPAGDTPLSCIRLVRIMHEAGVPEEWCQWIVPESIELAETLVTDPRVAFVSFIGSAKVGWYLRSKLPPGTRIALEHGGAAPVIITRDADIEHALPSLLKGAFYHAGQVCVSVQRIFVDASVAEEVASRIAEGAEKLIVGDPANGDTEVGPLIRKEEVERVDIWVKEAVKGGAKLLTGGAHLKNNCYAPTVLFNPPAEAKISTMEVFGPVVSIYPFTEVDAAIEEANSLNVAFQASVYSRDIDTALYISERLTASAVMVNDHTAFRVDWMPFAGLKHSGLGTGGIPHTMRDMQTRKMTVIYSEAID